MNEIFKGQDNAAEAINDNFQQLEMASGSADKSSWIILPNGLKICEGSFTFVPNQTDRFPLPIEFPEGRYTVQLTADGNFANQMNDVGKLNIGKRSSGVRLIVRPGESLYTSEPFEIYYTIIGR